MGDEHRGGLLVGETAHLLDFLLDGLAELRLGDLGIEVRVDVRYRTH